MRISRAFTLIELLVVVAIIALLIGITMPSIAGVRRVSKSAKCKHNLHAIGVGLESYFSRSGDLFPCMAPLPSDEQNVAPGEGREPYDPMPKALWTDVHNTRYTGQDEKSNTSELFECPADVVLKDDAGLQSLGIFPGHRYFDTETTSYEWNMLLNPDMIDGHVGPQKRRRFYVATLFHNILHTSDILRANTLSRTEMVRDFDPYHARLDSKAAINCLYGDLHVGNY